MHASPKFCFSLKFFIPSEPVNHVMREQIEMLHAPQNRDLQIGIVQRESCGRDRLRRYTLTNRIEEVSICSLLSDKKTSKYCQARYNVSYFYPLIAYFVNVLRQEMLLVKRQPSRIFRRT